MQKCLEIAQADLKVYNFVSDVGVAISLLPTIAHYINSPYCGACTSNCSLFDLFLLKVLLFSRFACFTNAILVSKCLKDILLMKNGSSV